MKHFFDRIPQPEKKKCNSMKPYNGFTFGPSNRILITSEIALDCHIETFPVRFSGFADMYIYFHRLTKISLAKI